MTQRTPGRHRRPGRLSTASHSLTRSAAVAATSTGLVAGFAVNANATPDSLATDQEITAFGDALQRIGIDVPADRTLTVERPAVATPAPAELSTDRSPAGFGTSGFAGLMLADFGTSGFTATTPVVEVPAEPAPAIEAAVEPAPVVEAPVEPAAPAVVEQAPVVESAPVVEPAPVVQAAPAAAPAAQAAPQPQAQARTEVAQRTETSASRTNERTQAPARPAQAPPATPRPAPPAPEPSPAPTGGVLSVAAAYTGIMYVYGGSTPAGFDCSGYTQFVFAQVGVSLPRTTTAQRAATTPVSNPQPGDLVFFGSPSYHVGIYAGNGMMYDSGRPGIPTQLRPVFSGVSGYGRVG